MTSQISLVYKPTLTDGSGGPDGFLFGAAADEMYTMKVTALPIPVSALPAGKQDHTDIVMELLVEGPGGTFLDNDDFRMGPTVTDVPHVSSTDKARVFNFQFKISEPGNYTVEAQRVAHRPGRRDAHEGVILTTAKVPFTVTGRA